LVLFLPNLDMYMMQFSTDTFLSGFGMIDPEKFARYYGLIVSFGLAVGCLLSLTEIPRERVLYIAATTGCATALWGSTLAALSGEFTGGFAFRTPAMLSFFIAVSTAMLTSSGRVRLEHFGALFIGATIAALIKLVYSVLTAASSGGVTIAGNVQAVIGDGQALDLIGFAAAINLGIAVERMKNQRKIWAFFYFVISLLLVFGLGLSFRRLAMIRSLVVITTGFTISGWLLGSTRRHMLVSGVVGATAGLMLFVAGVWYFGEDIFRERLRSLSLTGRDSGQFADSNEEYLLHWKIWAEVLWKSKFMGMGFGTGYSGLGPVDPRTGGAIPLHTGSYELFASTGLVGAGFWLGTLVYLPIHCLRRMKRLKTPLESIIGIVAAWTLFLAFFPMMAPSFYSPQTALLVGGSYGFLLNRLAHDVRLVSSGSIVRPTGLTAGAACVRPRC